MKKITILLSIFFMLQACSSNEESKADENNNNNVPVAAKGKLKTIEYDGSNNKLKSLFEYDENGRVKKVTSAAYKYNGEMDHVKTIFEFQRNGQGKIIKATHISVGSDGIEKVRETANYNIDANGKYVSDVLKIYSTGGTSTVEYTYTGNNITQYKFSSGFGYNFTYDSNSNLTYFNASEFSYNSNPFILDMDIEEQIILRRVEFDEYVTSELYMAFFDIPRKLNINSATSSNTTDIYRYTYNSSGKSTSCTLTRTYTNGDPSKTMTYNFYYY